MNNLRRYVLWDLISFICILVYLITLGVYYVSENIIFIILGLVIFLISIISPFIKYYYAFRFLIKPKCKLRKEDFEFLEKEIKENKNGN